MNFAKVCWDRLNVWWCDVSQPFSTKLNLALNNLSQSLHGFCSSIRALRYRVCLRCNAIAESFRTFKLRRCLGVVALLNTYERYETFLKSKEKYSIQVINERERANDLRTFVKQIKGIEQSKKQSNKNNEIVFLAILPILL